MPIQLINQIIISIVYNCIGLQTINDKEIIYMYVLKWMKKNRISEKNVILQLQTRHAKLSKSFQERYLLWFQKH